LDSTFIGRWRVVLRREKLKRHILQHVFADEALFVRRPGVSMFLGDGYSMEKLAQELVYPAFTRRLTDNAYARLVFVEGLRCIRPIASETAVVPRISMRPCRIEDIHRLRRRIQRWKIILRGREIGEEMHSHAGDNLEGDIGEILNYLAQLF